MATNIIFFFNDTATTEIYTLSLHDALPIWRRRSHPRRRCSRRWFLRNDAGPEARDGPVFSGKRSRSVAQSLRSEEHTSELQSRQYLVCRLLLEKKNTTHTHSYRLE